MFILYYKKASKYFGFSKEYYKMFDSMIELAEYTKKHKIKNYEIFKFYMD